MSRATDELMLPSYDAADNYSTDDDAGTRLPGGVGGKRIESWLEPAWRSDRMCWMLLSTAMGLAYELGVFDDMEELIVSITRVFLCLLCFLTIPRPTVVKWSDRSTMMMDTN